MTTNDIKMVPITDLLDDVYSDAKDFAYDVDVTSDEYLGDSIMEYADGNTSIYYSDIEDFIRDNLSLVEDAISEFGWDGCGEDLHKAGQLAEFSKIQNDLLSCNGEIWAAIAYNYLKYNLEMDEIPEELYEKIMDWADELDSGDKIGTMSWRIDEWLADQEEDEDEE